VVERDELQYVWRSLSSFDALATAFIWMPVPCARRLTDLCGVCPKVDLVSFSVASVITRHFCSRI
jgi:hypothetical protein